MSDSLLNASMFVRGNHVGLVNEMKHALSILLDCG